MLILAVLLLISLDSVFPITQHVSFVDRGGTKFSCLAGPGDSLLLVLVFCEGFFLFCSFPFPFLLFLSFFLAFRPAF